MRFSLAFERYLRVSNEQVRVNLNMPIKSEVKAEAADVQKSVDEDRKLLIQAVIVRIMKSRKVSLIWSAIESC